jgi:two-component system, OmpR family, sensor kinase
LAAVGGALFVRSFRSGQIDSLERGLVAQADTLARQLRDPTEGLDLGVAGPTSPVATGEIVAQVLEVDGTAADSTREAGKKPVVDAATLARARQGRTFADVHLDRDREPFRVLAQPETIGNVDRVLVLGTSLEETNESVDRVRDDVLIWGSAAVVLAAIGGWLLATAALRPVEQMRREAAAISGDNSAARLRVPATRDEVASLGTTMNELLSRLHGALRRQREFVADAGHELRTPLAVLQTELELAQRQERTPDELRDAIEHAAVETDRLARLADELLFLARGDAEQMGPRLAPVDLDSLLKSVSRAYSATAEAGGVTLQAQVPVGLVVQLDEDLVRRALGNLLDNAIRFAPDGSTVALSAALVDDDLEISVHDEGSGFPSEFLPHAFERFRRADDARTRRGGGAGLGLAIVREVARAHSGIVVATNAATGGAIVTLRLPTRP